MIDVVIPNGKRVRVRLADADGEFIISYGKTKKDTLTVEAELPDTRGRYGIIYEEFYGDEPLSAFAAPISAADATTSAQAAEDAVTIGTVVGIAFDNLHGDKILEALIDHALKDKPKGKTRRRRLANMWDQLRDIIIDETRKLAETNADDIVADTASGESKPTPPPAKDA